MSDDGLTFGERLRAARLRRGLHQAELGALVLRALGRDVIATKAQNTVSRLEAGRAVMREEDARAIAEALRLALGEDLGVPPVVVHKGRPRRGPRTPETRSVRREVALTPDEDAALVYAAGGRPIGAFLRELAFEALSARHAKTARRAALPGADALLERAARIAQLNPPRSANEAPNPGNAVRDPGNAVRDPGAAVIAIHQVAGDEVRALREAATRYRTRAGGVGVVTGESLAHPQHTTPPAPPVKARRNGTNDDALRAGTLKASN